MLLRMHLPTQHLVSSSRVEVASKCSTRSKPSILLALEQLSLTGLAAPCRGGRSHEGPPLRCIEFISPLELFRGLLCNKFFLTRVCKVNFLVSNFSRSSSSQIVGSFLTLVNKSDSEKVKVRYSNISFIKCIFNDFLQMFVKGQTRPRKYACSLQHTLNFGTGKGSPTTKLVLSTVSAA